MKFKKIFRKKEGFSSGLFGKIGKTEEVTK